MTRNPTDPMDAVEAVLVELAATGHDDTLSANEEAAPDPAAEAAIEALLTRASLPINPVVEAVVDKLLSANSLNRLSVERRKALMDAADSALAERRRDTGTIQSVLRSRRYNDGTPLSDLVPRIQAELGRVGANAPAIEIQTLRQIENGAADIKATEVLRTIAAWTVVCGIPRNVAVKAYGDAIATLADEAPLRSAAGADPHDHPSSVHTAVIAFASFLDQFPSSETEVK